MSATVEIRDPRSPAEWRAAAVLAAAVLLIDDARLYGFVSGGPGVDRARCDEILHRAEAEHDIFVTADEASDLAVELMAGLNAQAAEVGGDGQ